MIYPDEELNLAGPTSLTQTTATSVYSTLVCAAAVLGLISITVGIYAIRTALTCTLKSARS